MERPIYIAGDKVSLGIFQKGDVDTLYQGINNLHIQKQLRSPMPYMYENEEKWYQSLHEEWKKQFVIIQNDTQEIIGSIGFNTWSDIHRSGELGATLYRDEYL